MNERWIVNASPVIALAKTGQLDLLIRLVDQILLPEAVVSEIVAGPASDLARQALKKGWGKPVPVGQTPEIVLEWSLGKGETAVLTAALENPGCWAVLDDAEARMCARTFGIPIIGTLGVVLRAKKQGLVSSAAEIIRALRLSGLYLDDQTVRTALRRVAGEEWHL